MDKKVKGLISCVIFLLALTTFGIWFNSPDIKTRRTVNKIVQALNEKDEDKLYKLFSEEIKENQNSLKEDIVRLFSKYKGKCEKIKFDSSGGESSFEKGQWYSFVDSFYHIWFSGNEYGMFYSEYTSNMFKKEKRGLQCLAIYPISEEKEFLEMLKKGGDVKKMKGILL